MQFYGGGLTDAARTFNVTGMGMNNYDALAREGVVTVHGSASGFAQVVETRSHRLGADEPLAFGGTDTGPTPYDLLLAALGT